jgi:hypothetical protein
MDRIPLSPLSDRTAVSRRRMLGLSTAAVGLATVGAAGCGSAPRSRTALASRDSKAPLGVLGANLNENLPDIDFAELRSVSATWLRGFYNMADADQGTVAGQPGIQRLMTAVAHGYHTILSLKFDYPKGLPAPGGGEMNRALARLDKVLVVVMGKVDILVIGNEPFYECGRQYANLNAFYETAARHTSDYRQRNHRTGEQTQIYMGAITDIEDPKSHTTQAERWLEFVRNTPYIAGTDCHPHVASLNDGLLYPKYILSRIRADQNFLATEFSLIKLYKKHMSDPVSATFADRYGISRGTPVWQVARGFIAHPVTQAEWNDFLLSCPWFAGTRNFMTDLVTRFRATRRCAAATYGLTQGAPSATDFGPGKPPWIFTSMFCPRTTRPGTNGLPGQNTTWTRQFRALQHSG